MIKTKFTLMVVCCFGLGFANELQKLASYDDTSWKNLVMDELPKLGTAGGTAEEQKCLDHLAQKGISATILAHQIIGLPELNDRVRASTRADFSHILRYYRDRVTLAAHKDGKTITFFFNLFSRGSNQLWCFAEKDLP